MTLCYKPYDRELTYKEKALSQIIFNFFKLIRYHVDVVLMFIHIWLTTVVHVAPEKIKKSASMLPFILYLKPTTLLGSGCLEIKDIYS